MEECNYCMGVFKAMQHGNQYFIPFYLKKGSVLQYIWKDEEERLCSKCNHDGVENELHALLECTVYTDIRPSLLTKLAVTYIMGAIVLLKKQKQLKLIPGCNDEILIIVPKPAMIY